MGNKLTDGGRAFTRLESYLADYLDNERQAMALAPLIERKLQKFTGDSQLDLFQIWDAALLERLVTAVLVDALEAAGGLADVEYAGGERRDTLRDTQCRTTFGRLA